MTGATRVATDQATRVDTTRTARLVITIGTGNTGRRSKREKDAGDVSMTDSNLQQIVKESVALEFAKRQGTLLQHVKGTIADVLKNDQRVIVIADQNKAEKKSRKWEIAQIVVPAILTGLVGFGVWYTQNSLSKEITVSNQAISTRYVLTQEYYKERFKVYQQTYERLAALQGAFEAVQTDANAKPDAIAARNGLDDELARQELYFSPEILKRLDGISFVAAQMPTVNPNGTSKLSELEKQILVVKQKMYEEVSGEIGNLGSPVHR
jgi:hypothetical protein